MNSRGKVNMKEVEERIGNMQSRSSSYFLDWIPNNIQTTLCSVPPAGLNSSSTFIGNSTAIQEPLKRIADQFNYLFRRKMYLKPYSWHDMDELEFTVAESVLQDTIAAYQEC